MNVYQRPLFRQMGGPVAPGMAAQEAMAPAMAGQDPAAMLQQAEMMAAQQAQGVGEQYAQGTLANIDRAETPEQIINALRGNEVPMEQRYAELAQFVGEADAQRTPESVLALVQPTIMMTEQGAMDSGVGELMQTLLGEVEMETADGAPTPMGQGVGSLMMAGAPEAQPMGVGQQPVANFRQGGVVQRFQAGGEASRLQALYSEMLPVYQGILGDGGEQRRMTQAQILFDIADRAGAFAAGIDPRTGQSMARLSPAAQLAGALSGLGGQIGERIGSQEEQDRALRLAALQAAQGEYSAERAAARAAAAGGRDRGIGDAYEAVDAEGNVIATEFLSTRSDLDSFREANPGATIRKARETEPEFDVTTLYGPDGRPVSFNIGTAAGIAEAQAALSGGFSAVAPPAPGEQVVLLNPQNPADSIIVEADTPEYNQALRMGFRTAEDIEALRKLTTPAVPTGEFINILMPDGTTQSVRADDPQADALIREGGRRVSTTAAPTPNILTDTELMGRYGAGETTPEETARVQEELARRTSRTWDPDRGYVQPEITPLILQAEQARRDAGLPTVLTLAEQAAPSPEGQERLERLEETGGAAFGSGAFFRNIGNVLLSPTGAVPAPQTQEAINAVTALNQDALISFRELTAGRPAQDAINQFQTLLPDPAMFFQSPRGAASQVQQLIDLYNANIAAARDAAASGTASATQRQQLEQAIISAQRMVDAYSALRAGILSGTTGGGNVDASQFRR